MTEIQVLRLFLVFVKFCQEHNVLFYDRDTGIETRYATAAIVNVIISFIL